MSCRFSVTVLYSSSSISYKVFRACCVYYTGQAYSRDIVYQMYHSQCTNPIRSRHTMMATVPVSSN